MQTSDKPYISAIGWKNVASENMVNPNEDTRKLPGVCKAREKSLSKKGYLVIYKRTNTGVI